MLAYTYPTGIILLLSLQSPQLPSIEDGFVVPILTLRVQNPIPLGIALKGYFQYLKS